MTEQPAEYFCTRPKLAAFLMENGFSGEQTVNPFKKGWKAWVFKKTPDLEAALAEFFAGTGETR